MVVIHIFSALSFLAYRNILLLNSHAARKQALKDRILIAIRVKKGN
jgi:hypothetical protein